MRDVRLLFSLLLLVVTTMPLFAADQSPTGTDSLRRFFNEVNNFNARFDQVVYDETHSPIQESSGTLWIQRPNKFRWDYAKPFKQEIVADGKKLWVYDPGLEQVTVRKLAKGLGDTPAMLLAGKGRLQDSFTVKPLADEGKLTWVQLIPRRKESNYDDIRIGFARGKLHVLEMVDGFGHTTRVTLSKTRENAGIDAKQFRFSPPEGVDVVGE